MSEPAFEVLDALGGFARLAKRTPLLDGTVPLRVAQGCVPLLEGNAFGFQVVIDGALRARRGGGRGGPVGAAPRENAGRLGGGVTLEIEAPLRDKLAAAHAGAMPRLVAQGFLREGGAWARRLAEGFYWVERAGLARSVLRLWTGLLVRPRGGVWLRVSDAANRRNRLISIRETFVEDGSFVPLVLDITLGADSVLLQGEVACLAPFSPDVTVGETDLGPLGSAHAAFYDEKYFKTKKGEITKKYRRMVGRERASRVEGPGALRLARVGPSGYEVERVERLLGAESTDPVPRKGGRSLEHVRHENAVGFSATYDGHNLEVTPDARTLAAGAAAVEKTWLESYGPGSVERDRRALWYLTKYFTPHPPGEPHFFVKPWVFTATPPGWSSVVEGIHGEGYDVLRGVVSTDIFFATPAVFALHGTGSVSVPRGQALLKVFAVPRWLAAAPYKNAAWLDGAP